MVKVVPRYVDRPSNDLQTAMSALENAISMLGSVTATKRPDAYDVAGGKLDWPTGVGVEQAGRSSGSRWSLQPQKTGGTAAAELSNTLSLLDSTIVAIDSAMSPPSSTLDTDRHQSRSTNITTDFRRSDVINITSGLRQTDTHPSRIDSGITSGGGSCSWRGQAWSGRTHLDLLQRIDNVELDVRQTGNAIITVSVTTVSL